MIRALVQHALRILALLAVVSGTAAAQSAVPALRASVKVSSNIVRIGDLVENAGAVADIPIFRSPDLGTTGAVSTERVLEAIRPHQLIDIDTRGISQVVVTRLSRAIPPQEISARVARALAGQYGLGDAHHIQLNFDRPLRTLQVEPGAAGELQASELGYDARTGRFEVTLDLPSSVILHQRPLRFTGTAIATIDAIEVNRPIEVGQVLQASDLTLVQRPKSLASGISEMAGAVGMAARHELRPGQPLSSADLMKPQIVQRNDTVTVVYEAPGLTLTLRGKAQDPGALGDTIGVLNSQSKRIVQGVVSGPDRVSVGPAPIHLVENASSMPSVDLPAGEPAKPTVAR